MSYRAMFGTEKRYFTTKAEGQKWIKGKRKKENKKRWDSLKKVLSRK